MEVFNSPEVVLIYYEENMEDLPIYVCKVNAVIKKRDIIAVVCQMSPIYLSIYLI